MTIRYWCHQCNTPFSSLEEITQCTECGGNFIEKLEHPDFERTNNIQIQVPEGVDIPPQDIQNLLNFIRLTEDGMILNMLQESQMDRAMEESLNAPPPTKKVCSKFIKSLQETKLNDDELHKDCVICQDNFKGVAIHLPCHHLFHKECILGWFNNQNTCPECRHEYPLEDSS